jgi:integrase
MGKRSDVRLTTRTVQAAKAGTIAWDAEVKGFGLRVMRSGSRIYVLKYRAGGRQRWITIGAHGSPWTADKARDRAKELLGQVAKGTDPAALRDVERSNPTVAALAKRFLAEHVQPKTKPKTLDSYRAILQRFIVPGLGTTRVKDVTAADISSLHHALRATPRQANLTVAIASKMFALAERWLLRPQGSNPCRMVDRFREARRERFLSAEEVGRLGETLARCERGWTDEDVELWQRECWDEALAAGKTSAQTAAIVADRTPTRREPELPSTIAALRLLVLTGARMSEVLGLRWEWVDLKERVLRLPNSKTGAKVIPLAPAAALVIEAQQARQERASAFVLPGGTDGRPLADLERPWRRIRRVAGMSDVRVHDLRHTFASHGVMGGLSLPILGKVLVHKSSATTQRYAHFAADPVRQAAEAVAKPLADLLMPAGSEVAEVRTFRRAK